MTYEPESPEELQNVEPESPEDRQNVEQESQESTVRQDTEQEAKSIEPAITKTQESAITTDEDCDVENFAAHGELDAATSTIRSMCCEWITTGVRAPSDCCTNRTRT